MGTSRVISELSGNVREKLQQLFESRGRGTKAHVERELGLHRGYFNNPRRADLGVGIVLAALKELGVKPEHFFRHTEDKGDIWGDDPPPKLSADSPGTVIARRYGIPIEGEDENEP